MHHHELNLDQLTRRQFFGRTSTGLASIALASLLNREASAKTHFPATAKRVIFLTQSGAPSQLDLFDPKPHLKERHNEDLPESVRQGQRLTTMTSQQNHKPIAASPYQFAKHGKSGLEFSELLPFTSQVADELCVVRSMFTEAINHDPAIAFLLTGSQQPGRPSLGAWLSYGLGNENENLPTFAVFISGGEPGDQPLNGRLWGSAFLPSEHAGVKFRSGNEPVLYLANPPGIRPELRRKMLDSLHQLNRLPREAVARSGDATALDADLNTQIAKFEMAYRMQTAVPELTDLRGEPEHTFKLYGEEARQTGTFAANCLLARRMVERGVRFVQLFHRGWDHHENLPGRLPAKCRQVDQASAALVRDLRQRGLLDDTLIVWGGEFGRTVYSQGAAHDQFGRDHHPRCFSIWLAGGGVRPGMTFGKTDDFSYNIAADPVHVHDLQATLLHCLGLDHEQLTFRHQGRDFRLTDIAGTVVKKILRG